MQAERLTKLQSRVTALRDAVSMGIAPEHDQILACEAMIEELGEERAVLSKLASSLAPTATPTERKLAKDFMRYVPIIVDVLARANQACFEARMSLQQLDEPQLDDDDDDNEAGEHPIQQQQQLLVNHEQDEESTKLMKSIEQRAQSVRVLNEHVGVLVSTQGDDVNQVSHMSSQSRDDVVHGLGELAELKKREAGKHTVRGLTTSAVIGGSVGLIAGPFGVAIGLTAGAVVGSLLGSTVAGISRRNIDREVRAFKEKFKLSESAEGYMVCKATVYENEHWSFSQRAWVAASPDTDSLLFTQHLRAKWTLDDVGTMLKKHDPSPMNPMAPPRPPRINIAPSNNDGIDLEEEVLPPGVWQWEEGSMWIPDIGDDSADTGGWKYAYSFQEGAVWSSASTRTSLVRRRCWARNQVLIPQRIATAAVTLMPSSRPVTQNGNGEGGLLGSAIDQMDQSLRVSEATLGELRFQGKQLNESARDVAILEDASQFASRVSRAVTLSGVIRNTLSSRPDNGNNYYAQETVHHHVHVPRQYHHPQSAQSQVDQLQRLCAEQLELSHAMQQEVQQQNVNIDSLQESTERSALRVERAKDMI